MDQLVPIICSLYTVVLSFRRSVCKRFLEFQKICLQNVFVLPLPAMLWESGGDQCAIRIACELCLVALSYVPLAEAHVGVTVVLLCSQFCPLFPY